MKNVIIISQHPQNTQILNQVFRKRDLNVKVVYPPDWTIVEQALNEWREQVLETVIILDCDNTNYRNAHRSWLDDIRNRLYRCPIIVLCQPELSLLNNQPELCFVPKPQKLQELNLALEKAAPCSVDALYDRVERLIIASIKELESLQWKLEGTIDRLSLAEKIERVASYECKDIYLYQDPVIKRWLDAAQSLVDVLRSSQVVPTDEIRDFVSTIPKAEETTRKHSKSGARWAGELHKLNGTLRSLSWSQGWSIHRDTLLQLLAPLVQNREVYREILVASGLEKLLNGFYDGLKAALTDEEQTNAIARLRNLCETYQNSINDLLKWVNNLESRRAKITNDNEQAKYQQIIVIEDDETWREKMLLPLLRKEFPVMDLLSAKDYLEARELLQKSKHSAIVLVDLGLPPAVEKCLGLELLKEFIVVKPMSKFIVLTAAQNYDGICRQALMAGLSPHNYAFKDPEHWEEEVITRVYTSMQPTLCVHRIEVYEYTGRLISIDGVGIEMEHNPFRLFTFLAHNSRRKWTTKEIISEVTGYPYYIFDDPGEGTPQGIANYFYDIRQSIAKAFISAQQPIDPSEVIKTDTDTEETRYYLTSKPIIYEAFENISHVANQLSVLVVEDDPRYAQIIVSTLKSKGLSCEIASSVIEAKQKIDAFTPQIVTLDLQLPRNQGESVEKPLGLEVLDYLKEHIIEAKVAVLTNIEWQDDIRLKINLSGVHIRDYISKAWDHAIERLVQSVWRIILELEYGLAFASIEEPPETHHIKLDDSQPGLAWIDGLQLHLPKSHYKLLRILVKSRNSPVKREDLKDQLWPDLDKWPDDINKALNTKMNQLKKAIRQQTKNQVNPDHLIRSYDGAYCLQTIPPYLKLNLHFAIQP